MDGGRKWNQRIAYTLFHAKIRSTCIPYCSSFITYHRLIISPTRRHEALKAGEREYRGKSTKRGLISGQKFAAQGHAVAEELQDQNFIVKSLEITADQKNYSNKFTALSDAQPFFITPEEGVEIPRILSTQTAMVVGDDNDVHVHSENTGMVRVRFHWDYRADAGDTWCAGNVRVASSAAGANRGIIFPPQIGEEVVISFTNGDPDKPLIIGSVFSGTHTLPFQPGTNPGRSIIKTSGDAKSNRIQFDDKPGSEKLSFNAKKDLLTTVLNDQTITVTKNDTESIGANRSVTIGKNDTLSVTGNRSVSVTKNLDVSVTENANVNVQKNMTLQVTKNLTINVTENIVISGKSITIESTEGDIMIGSAKNMSIAAAKNIAVTSDKDTVIKATGNLIAESSKNISIKASKDIVQKGKNITIKGSKVKVN